MGQLEVFRVLLHYSLSALHGICRYSTWPLHAYEGLKLPISTESAVICSLFIVSTAILIQMLIPEQIRFTNQCINHFHRNHCKKMD